MTVRPAKTRINLGMRPVWSESLLCVHWVAKSPSFYHADSKDSDQTGRMPRLIWVFAGRSVILWVLSWGSSLKESAWIVLMEHSLKAVDLYYHYGAVFCTKYTIFIFLKFLGTESFFSLPEQSSRRAVALPLALVLALALAFALALASASTNVKVLC